jgi:hypothetical protein
LAQLRVKATTDADRFVNQSLLKQAQVALRNMVLGALVMCMGACFFWLCCNSLHLTDWVGGLPALIHALTVQEVCLAFCLIGMIADGREQLNRAKHMLQVADQIQQRQPFTPATMQLSTFCVLTDWSPFWTAGVGLFETYTDEDEAEQVRAEIDYVNDQLNNIVGEKADLTYMVDDLFVAAKITKLEGYREFVYFILNAVAFYGYLLGIVVYYFGDELKQPALVRHLKLGMTNSDADWRGNFTGDAAWTIEPMIILASPLVFKAMRPRKQEGKEKKD